MATTRQIIARDVGDRIAEELRDDPGVRRVWFRDVRNRIEIWVVAEPIDDEAELRLYALPLAEWFPETPIRLSIVNPRDYAEDIDLERDVIPSAAVAAPRR